MSLDLDSLSLTDIIRLQTQLSAHLSRRFEKYVALVFSDIVGSTAYFKRFGDEAGHRIQQQHIDILNEALTAAGGRCIHTAGDGAFLIFPRAESAVQCVTQSQREQVRQQGTMPAEQRWTSRSSIHWGPVLTDGQIVAGDAANLCAKLAATVKAQEILLTKQALEQLPKRYAALCRPLDPVRIAGIADPFEVYQLPWQERAAVPGFVVIEETGQRIPIPDKTVVSCGRLQEQANGPANDIVLTLQDPTLTQRISRWHFELRREGTQLWLRSVTEQPTELNGVELRKGDQSPVVPGSTVRLSGIMTLHFEAPVPDGSEGDLTLPFQRPT